MNTVRVAPPAAMSLEYNPHSWAETAAPKGEMGTTITSFTADRRSALEGTQAVGSDELAVDRARSARE
jgi:hypothetical protein